jgi:hypothetical protein
MVCNGCITVVHTTPSSYFVIAAAAAAAFHRSERLKGAVACYAAQNVCIALSAAAAGVLVWFKQHRPADLSAQVSTTHCKPLLLLLLCVANLLWLEGMCRSASMS